MGMGALLNFVERMYHERKLASAANAPPGASASAAGPKGAGAPEASRPGGSAAANGAAQEPGTARPSVPDRGVPEQSPSGASESGLLHSVHQWKQRIGARLRRGAEVGRCTRMDPSSGLDQPKVEMG